jgi:phosphoribosyl-ATP pyrophosphohydrolase/phosphoribosyl-AMP cyclohydrolase
MKIDPESLDWLKGDGLIPAVVQDSTTGQVLMLAYMNREAFEHTLASGKVTFWSRSRQQLWTKGETSGNHLIFEGASIDCDNDTILITARPLGPVCHRGTVTCFEDTRHFSGLAFLNHLEDLIRQRQVERPEGSYTTSLFHKGTPEISKKVGEEAIEVVISAQQEPRRTVEEVADLVYHLLVFLTARDVSLGDVVAELESRHGLNQSLDGKKGPQSNSAT